MCDVVGGFCAGFGGSEKKLEFRAYLWDLVPRV